jgi:MFS family permease
MAVAESSSGFTFSRPGSIIAALGQTLLLFALTTLPTPLYGDYARAFGFSILTLTLIYAVYVAGTLSTLLLLGRLSDQIGRRRVGLIAIAAALLTALLFIMTKGTAMLFAARLATGIAAGLSSGAVVAWLRELHGKGGEKTGTLRTVAVNVLGLGVGPLICGLAAGKPGPSAAPYEIYAILLLPLAALVFFAEETVEEFKPVTLGLRLGVPPDKRAQFAGPGITTFVLYSLVGFYSALVPNLLSKTLHLTGHLTAGLIVFELFLAAALSVYATGRLGSRAAMLWGTLLMLPALAFLAAAESMASLPALVAGSAFGGISLGAGYRGALETAGRIAPGDKRAELMSMLFVCGNLGLALPVIGVGVLSTLATPQLADRSFAGVIALLSLAGLGFGLTVKEQPQAEG